MAQNPRERGSVLGLDSLETFCQFGGRRTAAKTFSYLGPVNTHGSSAMFPGLIFLAISHPLVTSSPISSALKKCDAQSDHLDACILSNLNVIVPSLKSGWEWIDFPGIDPIELPRKMTPSYHDGNLTLDLVLSNTELKGLSDTRTLVVRSKAFSIGKLEVMTTTPSITFRGGYTSDGYIGIFPLHSSGTFNITLVFFDVLTKTGTEHRLCAAKCIYRTICEGGFSSNLKLAVLLSSAVVNMKLSSYGLYYNFAQNDTKNYVLPYREKHKIMDMFYVFGYTTDRGVNLRHSIHHERIDVNTAWVAYLTKMNDGKHNYLMVDNLKLDAMPVQIYIDGAHSFDGSNEIAHDVKTSLNTNSIELYDLIKPLLMNFMSNELTNYINVLLGTTPIEDMVTGLNLREWKKK